MLKVQNNLIIGTNHSSSNSNSFNTSFMNFMPDLGPYRPVVVLLIAVALTVIFFATMYMLVQAFFRDFFNPSGRQYKSVPTRRSVGSAVKPSSYKQVTSSAITSPVENLKPVDATPLVKELEAIQQRKLLNPRSINTTLVAARTLEDAQRNGVQRELDGVRLRELTSQIKQHLTDESQVIAAAADSYKRTGE